MRLFSKFTLLTLSMLILACVVIQAQAPSVTARPKQIQAQPQQQTAPVGCTRNCLWYAGDTVFAETGWNALWNGYNPNYAGYTGQTWVPFFAAYNSNGWYNAVKITSVTFNEVTSSATAPNVTAMTYAFKTGISEGSGGSTVASGNCTYIQPVATGRSGYGDFTEYAYTCQLATPVTVYTGSVEWVNILPTISNDDTNIYLSDAISSPQVNHIGWGDLMNMSYFNGSDFNANYDITTNQGLYLQGFSVGMTGTYQHVTGTRF
jgi:hypothetical protein